MPLLACDACHALSPSVSVSPAQNIYERRHVCCLSVGVGEELPFVA